MDDLVSRTFMKSMGAKCLAYRDKKSGKLIAIMDIDLLPPAQPEPCEDALGVNLHVVKISKHCSDFSDLDNVKECEDAVSRQAAINTMYELMGHWFGADSEDEKREIKREFDKLPPAQPEQWWIPVTERLPKNRDWVLGIFQEGDTGWINPIPFICDYVGKKTPITTQDNWLLKLVDEPNPYYEKLHCIAWMPLPEPYRGEGE